MAVEAQAAQQAVSASDSTGDSKDNANVASKQLRRACDCCRKRKVRCDGQDPCSPCKKASIRCAYLQPPKKKGPKGLRSARVLHALRRIDDTASGSPTGDMSPDGPFGNWQWSTNGSPTAASQPYHAQMHGSPDTYGQQPSVAPDQHPYYQQMPTSVPQQQQPVFKREPQHQYSWSSAPTESVASGSEGLPHVLSPTSSELYHHRVLTGDVFMPYVQLFFTHMFAIMPIIDRSIYLDPNFYASNTTMNSDLYCFLCSLCAATIVQLDDSIQQPPSPHPSKRADVLFADECIRERKTYDYIETMSTLSIMTSFFLFAYYGNHEKHAQAWHYLQESITFAENMEMDDEASYDKLDPVESQWRRRLYWLLFITERAYAVQRRKHTRLRASVVLPAVFQSEDPQLLNGFVNLANLFSAVDESFVSAWRGSRRASLNDEAWLAKTQKQLDETANAATGELTETQHLDISVTREWLHVLAWQMGVSNGLIWGQGEGGMRLDYPVELAKKVVDITSRASPLALDSHGIGMEQKLSDIAGCLADVLKCTAGDTSATFLEGKQYLDILLNKLSSMRGKESRYLKPLMAKMEGLMGYELGTTANLAPPEGTTQSYSESNQNPAIFAQPVHRWSMNESVSMLRTLSMSGSLGMPAFTALQEDWGQRRPSGRMLEDDEMQALQPWLTSAPMQTM